MADDPAPENDPTPDPPKADPIKQDDDWQAKARKHERDLKRERKAREDLEAKIAQYDEASKSETEKQIDKARKEAAEAAKAEITGEFQQRILSAEIRAQAAGKFANPALAVKLLDLDTGDAFAGDEVNADAISKAIEDFLAVDGNEGLRAIPVAGGRPLGSVDAGKGAPAADSPEVAHQKFIAGVLTGRQQ